MKLKTCHTQGACLALRRCPYCRAPYYPFAPGAIERPARRRWSRTTRISVVRAALVLVLVVLGSMAAMMRLLTGGLL